MEIKELDLDKIRVSEFNTHKDLEAGTEDASVIDLANSISAQGLLSPITVRPTADGNYEVICGQRRFLACRRLGMTTISASVINEMSDTDATVVSLIENVHRADMNPMDKARAYNAIREKTGELKMVAKETGVSTQTVQRYLHLLNLSSSIQDEITTSGGVASVSVYEKIARHFPDDEDKQRQALDNIRDLDPNMRLRVLQKSGGDLEKMLEIKAQELENAGVPVCREGLCPLIPEELKEQLLQEWKEKSQH